MLRSQPHHKGLPQYRIAINAHLLSAQAGYRRAGIHQYIAQVLAHLPINSDTEYLVYSRHAEFLAEKPQFSMKGSVWPTERRSVRILWEQTAWPLSSAMENVDLIHGMAFVTPTLSRKPTVVTIYDLSFIHYPERFPKLQQMYLFSQTGRSVRKANRIITISDSTRRDVQQYFQVPEERIDVVMPGVDSQYRPLSVDQVDKFRTKEKLPEKIVLHVGTLQPRKNLPILLEAVAKLQRSDLLLVLIGGKGWHYDEIYTQIEELGIQKKVRFTGYVDDTYLPLWYNAASVLVFPSVYEGFGMPIIEAMACGTPVIATRSSSIPEAGGEAAQYFEPDNVESLIQKLTKVLDDDALANAMREKGLVQANSFSWKRAGEETATVYRKVMFTS